MSKTTTRRRTAPKTTKEERAAKVAALAERYAEFADSLDEEQQEAYAARFDHYSPRNALLIVMQMPDATIVHGIHDWNAAGRKIRKGEHGIQILAPAGQREVPVSDAKTTTQHDNQDEKTQTRKYFRLAYVFDISQTDPIS